MTTIMGVDISTKRVAVAIVDERGQVEFRVLDAWEPAHSATKLARAHQALVDWFRTFPYPDLVVAEKPMAPSKKGHDSLMSMYGVVLAALSYAFCGPVIIELVPTQWKLRALGYGNASKEAIMDFAIEHAFRMDSDRLASLTRTVLTQDEADAYGIARAGVQLYSEQISAV